MKRETSKVFCEKCAAAQSPESALLEEKSRLLDLVRQMREGYELILKSKCCPPGLKHGNECPNWIAEEALSESARVLDDSRLEGK